MIQLDGSHKEGGGALVRVALALSTLTGKEFKVTGIRSGRPKPGLKAQHLTAINALQQLCSAKTNEVKLGSTELQFTPGKMKGGKYEFDIGTAGSVTLLLQALIVPCLFAPRKVTLVVRGGTSGKWQASVDYLQNVLLPHLQRFVEKIELKILQRGYYPKGGGAIQLEITPRFKLQDFANFDSFLEELPLKVSTIKLISQGTLEQIRGVVNLSSELQEKQVGERIKSAAEAALRHYNVPINIRVEYAKTLSIGGEIMLWGLCSKNGKMDFDNPVILAGDALVEKGKSSEQIGKEAAQELISQLESKAAVGHHLADQLISFMALLPGSAMVPSEVTKHTETNIYVVEKFLPVGFTITEQTIHVEKKE